MGLLWAGVHASAQPAGQEAPGTVWRWSLPTTGHRGRGLRGHPPAQYCPTVAGHPFPPGVCVLKDTGGSRKQLCRGEAQRGGASSPSTAPFSSQAGCADLDQSSWSGPGEDKNTRKEKMTQKAPGEQLRHREPDVTFCRGEGRSSSGGRACPLRVHWCPVSQSKGPVI